MKKIAVIFIVIASLFSLLSCRDNKEVYHTVSFETNCEATLDDISVRDGKTFIVGVELKKAGAIFEGWYIDDEFITPYDFTLPVNEDITLYAKWKQLFPEDTIYHKVTFVLNGGKYEDQKYVIDSNTLILEDIPTKEYHSFVGWYTDEVLKEEFDFSTPITEDITLYAKWDILTYTLSFETNGGEYIENEEYYFSEITKAPLTPTKAGADFVGWYQDEECTLEFSFGNYLDKDTTIYAKWEYHIHSLTYISCGGVELEIQYYATNEIPEAPSDDSKEGYILLGWYLDPQYKNKFNFDSYIFEDTILYAKWEKNLEFNNDATLKAFMINGKPIPNFKPQTTSYSFTLPAGVDTVVINAEANDEYASISSGLGSFSLELGNVVLYRVKVISANGKYTKTYSVNVTSTIGQKNNIYYTAGLSESIAIMFFDANYLEAKLYYKPSDDVVYTEIDKELIRNIGGITRADILGLKPGYYDVKIAYSNGELTVKENIKVTAHDRSGYAFFDTDTNAIGAYNEDGSLKDNADIIYVTNETKNSVTYRGYVGLVSIIANASKFSNPVCIRIIGSITTNQFYYKNSPSRLADDSNYQTDAELVHYYTNSFEDTYGENLVGLKSNITISGKYNVSHTSTKFGSTVSISNRSTPAYTIYNGNTYPEIKGKEVYEDDSYINMVECNTVNGFTIEGVGTDAEIFQWGISFRKSYNVEVRNLTFTAYPEDAVAFIGNGDDYSYCGYWVHNCTFNRGVNNWDMTGEKDKYAGDGSIDVHAIHGFTLSYCRFNNTQKTGLVGSDETAMQYDITFHHNYYDGCSSRLPLARNSNIHIYNNYYYSCKSTIDARSNTYVFLEGNYFEKSKYPNASDSNPIYSPKAKSYNNYYIDCNGTDNQTIVFNRTETLDGILCSFNGISYANFDINPYLFYYDSFNQSSDVMYLTSPEQAKADCINYAGVLKDGALYGIFK